MKRILSTSLTLLLLLAMALSLVACGGDGTTTTPTSTPAPGEEIPATGLWENATYRRDTTLGEGSKRVEVEVKADGQSITFTVLTDADTLGAALLAIELIEGEDGQYGLYVKKVNGILADYDLDQSYWSFEKNGEYMMTGVDGTPISGGEHFELIYTK